MMKKLCLSIAAIVCAITFSLSAGAQGLVKTCAICNGQGNTKCMLCAGKGKWKAEINGKTKKIECPACKGTEVYSCWSCNGTGKHSTDIKPQTDAQHAEGYSWLWCNDCKKAGVEACMRCKGMGKTYAGDGQSPDTCPLCEGKRKVLCNTCEGSCGWYVSRERCDVCDASGSLTCNKCNGQGWLPPEYIERAYAEICRMCKGTRHVTHKKCEGKGCKHCKNGQVGCGECNSHGAVIVSPEPKYRDCYECRHKGVTQCTACRGRGYRDVTAEGVVR